MANKDVTRKDHQTPSGVQFKVCKYWYREDRTAHKLPPMCQLSGHDFFLDRARTADTTECPITMDPFSEPYIMQHSGRSYSRSAIMEAIDKTLRVGRDLRLEDGITLSYLQLPRLVLYPNLSLPGWKPAHERIQFCDKDVAVQKFNSRLAATSDLPDIARLLDTYGTDRSVLNLKHVAEYYLRHRSDETVLWQGTVFRNFSVTEIVFPRGHVKSDALFSNVKFTSCVFYDVCLCAIQFRGCCFDQCTIVLADGHISRSDAFHNCVFDGCRWVVQTKEPVKCIPGLPKGLSSDTVSWKNVEAGLFNDAYMLDASVSDIKRRGRAFGGILPVDEALALGVVPKKASADGTKWVPLE